MNPKGKTPPVDRSPLFATPGHFYSPIVNVEEVRRRFSTAPSPRTLPGIAIDDVAMLELWNTFVPYLAGMPFPDTKTTQFRFFFDNPAFSYADAGVLHAFLR